MNNTRCIASILKGLSKKTITRPTNQKKYFIDVQYNKKGSWQPLLLRDPVKPINESGKAVEKRLAYGMSMVKRYWNKEKSRKMVSSGPIIKKEIVLCKKTIA